MSPASRKAERRYRTLLGLLPRPLREGFQDEMVHAFLMRLGSARGPMGRAKVWARALLDLLLQGLGEHLRSLGRARWSPGSPPRNTLLGSFGGDLWNAGRTLRRDPSFVLMAAMTLALGIGGATVAFSLVKGVLLRPLPFPSDQDLVVLLEHGLDGEEQTLSFPNFDDFRTQTKTFAGIAALRFASTTSILGGAEPARGVIVPVSREFFSVIGVMPFLGRPILGSENRPGGEAVAVVGYRFWTRFLGSEERLENLSLTIEGTSFAVVGVMPPGFKVLEDADVYLPLEREAFMVRSSSNYRGIGRLAEGATLAQARTEMAGIVGRIRDAYPKDARLDGVVVRPLQNEVLGAVTRPLWLLFLASGLFLLLACSNVASALMARSVRREQDMAIRTALGGGRGRLVRMVLTEGLFLAALSGLVGVGLSFAALSLLTSAGSGLIPRLATVHVDGSVLGFALGATLLTSLVFGLLPACRLPEPAASLRRGSGGTAGRGAGPGWSLLVSGQVALAVSLLVSSGLLLRSMREILSADTHVRSDGVLTIGLDFSTAGLASTAERAAMLPVIREGLASLPGVTDVGFVSYLPQNRGMMTGTVFRPPLPVDGLPEHYAGGVGWRIVDQDYFRAMGIPLARGRVFERSDGPGSPPVIVLNESLARRLFPDRDAVGSIVHFDPFWRETDLEVVGVVAEARDWRVPAGEQPEGYVLTSQRPGYTRILTAVLHTDGNPAQLIPGARERLRTLLPDVPGSFSTLESLVADSYGDRSFTLGVLTAFALLSLFLSAVGIYGVVSYTVSAQAREIGIRLALGAERGEVRLRIFLRSARAVVAGVAAGLGLALLAGGLLESLLYGVEPRDPWVMAVAPLILSVAASVAILLPVLKHTVLDPVRAMRVE